MYKASASVAAAHADSIWSVCWAQTGQILTGSLDETVKLWEENEEGTALSERNVFTGHQLGVISVDASRAGDVFVSSGIDSNIRVWSEGTSQVIDAGPVETWTLSHHPTLPQVVSGSQSGNVNVWDLESREKLTTMETHGKFVMCVAYSPDGRRIAAGSFDGVVSIFDAERCVLLSKLEDHTMPVRSLKFSSSGRSLYTASDDGRVIIYDTSSAGAHASGVVALVGHTSWVLSVDVARDEVHVATGSSDKHVKIWDTRTREVLHTFDEHADQVWAVAYNPDGSKLCSVGDDARLQVYNVQ